MDVKGYLQELKEKNIIPEKELKKIVSAVKDILSEESNVQPVKAPIQICGDIHGQFFDVLELFRVGGLIPEKSYIFIGDFVDRGYNSVETFEYLLCLKLLYPQHITLLRGNHESRTITKVYGFYDEVLKKYGNANPWQLFTDLFDYLPLAALVEGKLLCVHGGLSPDIKTIDQIRTIDRRLEIPIEGAFADLMWSDPDGSYERFGPNPRGAGYVFGPLVTKDFCQINSLDLVCRAHQLVKEGYQYHFDNTLITIWSAPNYMYRMSNEAIVMSVDESLNRDYIKFKEVEESQKSVAPKNVLPYFL